MAYLANVLSRTAMTALAAGILVIVGDHSTVSAGSPFQPHVQASPTSEPMQPMKAILAPLEITFKTMADILEVVLPKQSTKRPSSQQGRVLPANPAGKTYPFWAYSQEK